jgi:hypothetical protein
MPDCVEHFIEGRNAWQIGLLGFFIKFRGFVTTAFITAITMGTPFWWPDIITNEFKINLKHWFVVLVFIAGCICIIGFYYLRYRSQRSLDIKHMLHEFAHFLRDYQTKVYNAKNLKRTHDHESENFKNYIEQICEKTKNHFERISGNHSIGAAIRIAVDKSPIDGKHEIFYKTVGRSSGLSVKRQDTSEDIASNVGIPRFFSDKKSMGVLIYNDIEKAAEINVYILTENDKIYKNEIKTMMVAPLNAWDGKKQSMIGILYVTSRESGIFKLKHTDTLRFIADMIAKSIGFTVLNFKNTGLLNVK